MVSWPLQLIFDTKKLIHIVVEGARSMRQLTRCIKQRTRKKVHMVLGLSGLGICILLSPSLLASPSLLVASGVVVY